MAGKSQHTAKNSLRQSDSILQKQWHKLSRYIEDGNLNIDNNRAERAVKAFVIGRKNWLFSNTANGANASAMLYSMIETALCRMRHKAVYTERKTMPNHLAESYNTKILAYNCFGIV